MLLISAIIFLMSTETWGTLPKAGDNNQTIEQYVLEQIAAHNDDFVAHADTGQSIDEHRKNDILDHPAGAVLPDKISFNDINFETTFDFLTGFTKQGSVAASSWPGMTMEIADGGQDTASLQANFLGILTGTTATYDILFDTYFYRDSATDAWSLRVGVTNTGRSTHYLGFRVVGGYIRGYARVNGTYTETSDLFYLPQGGLNFVRVYYSYAEGLVYFYINGEQKGTLDAAAGLNIDNQFAFIGNAGTEEGCILRFFDLKFSRSF